MPTLCLSSFDWDQFGELLDQPIVVAAWLAKQVEQGTLPISLRESDLPRTEVEITKFVESRFGAADWYAGMSPREARTIDGIVIDLFEDVDFSKTLRVTPLGDGVMWEIVEIATGRALVDEARVTPNSRSLMIRKTEPADDERTTELASLGSRPFRHASWNRKEAEESRRLHNPFVEGIDASYFPDYSIHSPSEVERLRLDLLQANDRIRSALNHLKSKRIRHVAISNFEEDLAGSIEAAATDRHALIARWDY